MEFTSFMVYAVIFIGSVGLGTILALIFVLISNKKINRRLSEIEPMVLDPRSLYSKLSKSFRAKFELTSDISISNPETGHINRCLQFDICNSGDGAEDQQLRIGSVTGLPGAYLRHGLTKSAADNAIINDQFGERCLCIQGFSELTCFNEIIISEIHIISAATGNKEIPRILHREMLPDRIMISRSNFFDWSFGDLQNVAICKGEWRLSAREFFEIVVSAGTDVTILLLMSEIEYTKLFSKISNGK